MIKFNELDKTNIVNSMQGYLLAMDHMAGALHAVETDAPVSELAHHVKGYCKGLKETFKVGFTVRGFKTSAKFVARSLTGVPPDPVWFMERWSKMYRMEG